MWWQLKIRTFAQYNLGVVEVLVTGDLIVAVPSSYAVDLKKISS